MARPSRYTTKLGEAICNEIANGKGLPEIEKMDGMPSARQIHRWLASEAPTYAGFRQMYARAREDQADFLFDQIAETAADVEIDTQRARLIVDTQKWRLAKLRPRKYGTDRVEHAGDTDAPLAVSIVRVNAPPPDDA